MVISLPASARRRQAGTLITDIIIALAILAGVLLPVSFAFYQEMRLCRAYYYDAIAMELVDGEMELFAAGEWHSLAEGDQPWTPAGAAAANLPAGRFLATRSGRNIRLEWRPDQGGRGRVVVRQWRTQE